MDLVPGQQRHRLGRGESAPVGIAGSNQDVAIAAGEEGFDLLRCRGVVEDKEPVRVRAEPLLDCVDDGGLVGQVFFRQVELNGQGGVVRGQPGGFFGSQPPDQVILKGMAVSVLQGGLGLADAAEAVDCLGEDGGAILV